MLRLAKACITLVGLVVVCDAVTEIVTTKVLDKINKRDVTIVVSEKEEEEE